MVLCLTKVAVVVLRETVEEAVDLTLPPATLAVVEDSGRAAEAALIKESLVLLAVLFWLIILVVLLLTILRFAEPFLFMGLFPKAVK